MIAALVLSLTPWKGPSLPTASASAAQYRLTVHGAPETVVQLRAAPLPAGWIASFCTAEICSPFSYAMRLNARGTGTVEFQAIRNEETAPHRVRLTISAAGTERSFWVERR